MAEHLTDERLADCHDGSGTTAEIAHLTSCAECGSRLQQMLTATAAYVEYRDSIRAPMLPHTPQPWASLDDLIDHHQAESRPVPVKIRRSARWWAFPALAAALCAVAVIALLYRSGEPSRRVNDLLSRSAGRSAVAGRRIAVFAGGQMLVRPAVLTRDAAEGAGMGHLRTLFETAHYSWDDPLSARSFQTWRGGVRHRRDSVTVAGDGTQRSYRVRTEDPEGALRSASLTLRADDLRATSASLDFANEGTIDLAEAPTPEPPHPQPAAPFVSQKPAEVLAGPEDTLRVLAALNRIGADTGDPVSVSEDPDHRHIVVHAGSLSPQRQAEVSEALKPLPRVVVDLRAETGGTPALQPAERYSSSIPEALRTRLEEKVGGAVALQETTDQVLDASGLVLARAHAIGVLAEKFPPEIEARLNESDRALLRSLRRSHVAELNRLLSQMRVRLRPLLSLSAHPSDNATGGSWQAAAPPLVTDAQETDQLLNRLLAGSYSQAAGEEMLRNLSPQLDRLQGAIQSLNR